MSENKRKRYDHDSMNIIMKEIIEMTELRNEMPDNKRQLDANDDDSMKEIMELFPMGVQYKDQVNGYYPLHTACYHGNNSIAMRLIHLFPEAVHHPDLAPLNLACRFPQMKDVVWNLIDLFPEASQHKDGLGLYPLHLAIMNIQLEDLVMKLIEISPKAVIDSSTENGTALHFACRNMMSKTVIAKLIEINPLALQVPDRAKGKYPIHWAIEFNAPIEVIKLLLDNDPLGMQRRVKANNNFATERYRCTPFYLACETNNTSLVEYLLYRSDFQINTRDQYGYISLHYSFHRYHNEIVDIILHHPNLNVNVTNSFNKTLLHTIIQFGRGNPERCLYTIHKLLDHPFILIDLKNNDNKTPVEYLKDRQHILVERNGLNSSDVIELRYIVEIIRLLEEFAVKRRWQAYCYHMELISRNL